jgi:hypothetical protein
VQISEQHLSTVQQFALGGLRFLHFHDQIAAGEDGIGAFGQASASGGVLRVGQTRAQASAMLDQDLMPLVH